MVKGVSKTIIEVNNTGSKLFEKIVFYVTPEFGNLNAKQLKKAASTFSFQYNRNYGKGQLRRRRIIKRRIFIASVVGLTALVIALVILL